MKKIAILQSNYIPWIGYFDLIASVDIFILYDDMQYTRRDWRNRNQIKTPQGVQWLTVPIQVKGQYKQLIKHAVIDGDGWASTHWKTIIQNYSKAPYFSDISKWLEPLYLSNTYAHLSDLNRRFIEAICYYLEINTKIHNSWDYQLVEGKTKRLAELCIQAECNEYISGPSAKTYIDENVFDERGIKLTFFEYPNYSEYSQLWGKFAPRLSILDFIFNCGKNARNFMRNMSE